MSAKLSQLLFVELLSDRPLGISRDELQKSLANTMPHSKIVSDAKSTGMMLVAHQNYQVSYENGQAVPPGTSILLGSPIERQGLERALQQTWDWPEARAEIDRCTHRTIVVEMLALGLEYRARVDVFMGVLRALLEMTSPIAVHCRHSERILAPRPLAEALASSDRAQRVGTMFNVRLFRIESPERGETVMDTLGLATLGLPDLQLHSRGLPHGQLAGLLYNLAIYLFDKGDCIENGNTVQGLDAVHRWKCQHEEALVAPRRPVIDVDPGDPFAAGTRTR